MRPDGPIPNVAGHDHSIGQMPRVLMLAHITRDHGYPGPDAPSTTVPERQANMLAWHVAYHRASRP